MRLIRLWPVEIVRLFSARLYYVPHTNVLKCSRLQVFQLIL